MANPKFDTIEVIEGLGGKRIEPSRTLHKHHAKAGLPFLDGQSLLVAVLVTPHGDYLKKVSRQAALGQVPASTYLSTYIETPKAAFDQLGLHPRAEEILG